MAQIAASVPSFERRDDGVIFFHLQVRLTQSRSTTVLHRRYSEFAALFKKLQQKQLVSSAAAAIFPPKTYFSLSETALEARRGALDAFMRHVVACDAVANSAVQMFLDLGSSGEEQEGGDAGADDDADQESGAAEAVATAAADDAAAQEPSIVTADDADTAAADQLAMLPLELQERILLLLLPVDSACLECCSRPLAIALAHTVPKQLTKVFNWVGPQPERLPGESWASMARFACQLHTQRPGHRRDGTGDNAGRAAARIAAGASHVVVLSGCAPSGFYPHRPPPTRLWTWGDGTHGKLGHGETSSHVFLPRRVATLSAVRIVSVAAGHEHTAAVSRAGELFTWGSGDFGMLGHGDTRNREVPTAVELLDNYHVSQAAAGFGHTAALTAEGELFSWGRGDCGQLGHGDTRNRFLPTCVPWEPFMPGLPQPPSRAPLASVACSAFYTMAVAHSGEVFAWGWGSAGQLALHSSDTTLQRWSPARLGCGVFGSSAPHRACMVSPGASHVAVVTTSGKLFTWGQGEHGKLGHGDEANQHQPKLVEALSSEHTSSVAAGYFHTAALTISGALFTWGRCDSPSGTLGHWTARRGKPKASDELVPRPVAALAGERVLAVAVGVIKQSGRTFAVTSRGRLYSWGNGARWQLGHGDTRLQRVPKRVIALASERVCLL